MCLSPLFEGVSLKLSGPGWKFLGKPTRLRPGKKICIDDYRHTKNISSLAPLEEIKLKIRTKLVDSLLDGGDIA